MNQPIDSTFIPFPTPSAAAPHAAGAQASTANGAHQTAHSAVATTAGGGRGGADPAEDSPGGGAKRGRPSGCSDRVVAMMKDQIRRHGFSDTAAAESVGVSSTSISRWKKQDPELASELLKARFDCRIYHLEIIENAAAAENGRGWRASAWILERLFPGDYARKMAERFAYLHLQDKLQDREESAVVQEDIQIRRAEEKAQRARAAAAAAEAELEEARAAEAAARSGAAGLGGEPPRFRATRLHLPRKRRAFTLKAIPEIPEIRVRRSRAHSQKPPLPKSARPSPGCRRLRPFTLNGIPEIAEIRMQRSRRPLQKAPLLKDARTKPSKRRLR